MIKLYFDGAKEYVELHGDLSLEMWIGVHLERD